MQPPEKINTNEIIFVKEWMSLKNKFFLLTLSKYMPFANRKRKKIRLGDLFTKSEQL